MRIINKTYNIHYEYVENFDFYQKNEIVNYNAYLNLPYKIDYLANLLNKDTNTRQAICYGDGIESPSCLTSIQVLIDNNILYVIANFRSQHINLGVPQDSVMLNYLTTRLLSKLNKSFEKEDIEITCNVADYHDYKIGIDKYISILEEEMMLNKSAYDIIKSILTNKYSKLGDLYHGNTSLTLDEWTKKGGDEDSYYDCKKITIELYNRSLEFNYEENNWT